MSRNLLPCMEYVVWGIRRVWVHWVEIILVALEGTALLRKLLWSTPPKALRNHEQTWFSLKPMGKFGKWYKNWKDHFHKSSERQDFPRLAVDISKYHNGDCTPPIKIPPFDFIVRSSCHVWIPRVPIPLGFIIHYEEVRTWRGYHQFPSSSWSHFSNARGKTVNQKQRAIFQMLPLRKSGRPVVFSQLRGLFNAFPGFWHIFLCQTSTWTLLQKPHLTFFSISSHTICKTKSLRQVYPIKRFLCINRRYITRQEFDATGWHLTRFGRLSSTVLLLISEEKKGGYVVRLSRGSRPVTATFYYTERKKFGETGAWKKKGTRRPRDQPVGWWHSIFC